MSAALLDPYRDAFRPLRVCIDCYGTAGHDERCPHCQGERRLVDERYVEGALRARAEDEVAARAERESSRVQTWMMLASIASFVLTPYVALAVERYGIGAVLRARARRDPRSGLGIRRRRLAVAVRDEGAAADVGEVRLDLLTKAERRDPAVLDAIARSFDPTEAPLAELVAWLGIRRTR